MVEQARGMRKLLKRDNKGLKIHFTPEEVKVNNMTVEDIIDIPSFSIIKQGKKGKAVVPPNT